MPKMRMYKFWNEAGEEKEKEAMSLKKATMSVQSDFKDKVIGVEYTSKKGKLIETSVKIPMDRKIRQSMVLEQKRQLPMGENENINYTFIINRLFCL